MKKEKIIKIITPPVASSNIDLDLVKLTETLIKNKRCGWVGGILGGEFGYGCYFKNEVFVMRPYYWGDCDCGGEKILPNFKHYKSGLEIRWYKWIGRDMEFNRKITNKQWKEIFQECIESIRRNKKTKKSRTPVVEPPSAAHYVAGKKQNKKSKN